MLTLDMAHMLRHIFQHHVNEEVVESLGLDLEEERIFDRFVGMICSHWLEKHVHCWHNGYIEERGMSAYCGLCGKRLGWWCPDSQNHQCAYSVSWDNCDFCGEPDDRK